MEKSGDFGEYTRLWEKKLTLFSLSTQNKQSLLGLKHENIVKIHRFVRPFVLMQFNEGVFLDEFLHGKEQQDYSVTDALGWMLQVVKGLEYVHALHPCLVYGCLSPRNILFSHNFRCVKIAGLPFYMSGKRKYVFNEYVSPEVISIDKNLTQKCDIYSCGILLWELMTRQKPYLYESSLDSQLAKDVVEGQRPLLSDIQTTLPTKLKMLIQMCWSSDVRKRPSTKHLVSDVNKCLTVYNTNRKYSQSGHVLKAYLGAVVQVIDIKFLQKIGEGAFGVFYTANWSKTNRKVALNFFNDFAVNYIEYDSFIKRVNEVVPLKHVNILQIFGIAKKANSIYLLMEYSECGSLFNLLHGQEKHIYSEDTALNWMCQIAKGIHYLHKLDCELNCCIHGSLSSKKLFFFQNFEVLKISDYCSPVDQPTLLKSNPEKASIAYIAPEVLHGEACTRKSDVYSFGIIFWEVMARKRPFYNLNNLHLKLTMPNSQRGLRPKLSDIRKSKFKSIEKLIEICWDAYPEKRPTFKELVDILRDPELFEDEFDIFEAKVSIDFADINCFEIIKTGRLSNVYEAHWRGIKIALKKRKNKFNQEEKKHFNNFIEEVKQLSSAVHENIIKIYGISLCSKYSHVLMEFAEGGSLFSYLHENEQIDYTGMNVINWMIQCAMGISYLHATLPKPFIHGNLKSKSLFLTNNCRTLKIGGFGTKKWCTSEVYAYRFYTFIRETMTCVQPFDYFMHFFVERQFDLEIAYYMAPEVLRGDTCTVKSDVYSIGIIFWEMMSRRKPFLNCTEDCMQSFKYIENENFEEAYEMCLEGDPKKRPSAAKLLKILRNICTIDKELNASKSDLADILDVENLSGSEFIARGAFAEVYIKELDGKNYAVKKVCHENGIFKKEVELLLSIKHENIVQIFSYTFDANFGYLIMEFAECRSLYDYLHGTERRAYTMAEGIDWMIQCVKGICHLHHMKPKPIVHRDLKPHNLLLTNNYRVLKICDFGTAREQISLMYTHCGTPAYMAPEILIGNGYTAKCDIYSIGIILWQVVTREKPYPNVPPIVMMYGVTNGKRPPLRSLSTPDCDQIKTLIENCWDEDPTKRPTIDQIDLGKFLCSGIVLDNRINHEITIS